MTNAFLSAKKFFEDGFYPDAESRFESFVNTYTNSQMLASAILYQGRSRLGQSNYSGAITLLRDKLPKAGTLAEHYYYYIAETLLAQGNYAGAAETYAYLTASFPLSSLRLPAALGQARAIAKLNDWAQVIELLNSESGAFRTALQAQLQASASAQTQPDTAPRGFILLGQAFFKLNKLSEAEQVLRSIKQNDLTPELDWQRSYWLCRVQLADNHADQALQTCTNRLMTLCAGRWRDTTETFSIRGEIFEKLGRLQEATEAYTNNLASGLPAEIQRHALFKTVGLMLKQNQTQDAMRRLEAFIEKETTDSALDVARVTLGELQLKRHYELLGSSLAATNSPTNLLAFALTNFNRVIVDFPDSPLRGKAYLNRGWCRWAQGQVAEAKSDFAEAILHVQLEDQVVARFKLADAQFSLREYPAAVSNYNLVIQESEKVPNLRNGLFNKALLQLLRASIENNDSGSADSALAKILDNFKADFNDECYLLYGELQNSRTNSTLARQVFSEMIKKYPESRLRPETEYAIARSYTREGDWETAAKLYDRWVTNYPLHALLPQAEFSRALSYDKAGYETNALMLLTNFVVRFADHPLAPWAQNWIADFWFNRGDYVNAERSYQDLQQTAQKISVTNNLAYQARLMMGRCALARQGRGVQEAQNYFIRLIRDLGTDSDSPPGLLLAQTYFALGDSYFQEYHDSTNTLETLNKAVAAYTRITNYASANIIVPLAIGRIGDCHFEWAKRSGDTNEYALAIQCYQTVLDHPEAGISARSRAEVYLGLIAEKQGILKEAFDHYWRVLYDLDPDHFDPVWVKEAGFNAAQLCKKGEQADKAIKVYMRVLEVIPSLRPVIEKEITRVTTQMGNVKQ